ncbi:MAG: glycosyltransferase family 4 protein [Anaerolineae bacterium]
MHVGLNAHLLSSPTHKKGMQGDSILYRSAGISQYIYNFLLNLASIVSLGGDDGENLYTVFLGEREALRCLSVSPRFVLRLTRLPTIKPPVRILWEQAIQPFLLKSAEVELLHSLAFVSPAFSPCPSVVTIYDLSFLLYPQRFRLPNRLYLSLFTRLSARRARRVIAISESTKRDIVRLLGISEQKVAVIYPGLDGACRPLPPEDVAAFRARRGLPERFIFFLGTLEPRKNVPNLVRAYALLRQKGSKGVRLVIAGARGWMYEDIFATVEALGLGEEVVFPGYIPQEELPFWYNAAEVFVYPSLYEGFGMPVLEAMACGTPAIVADASSLPEVVGGAGLKVPPLDAESLAEAMRLVLSDGDLRQNLSLRGLEKAACFSWREVACQTLEVYRQAYEISYQPSAISH